MDHVECIVAGAGIVGLATARALALAGREVLILEAEGVIGSGTSSRNSGVIHAGIYYPQGSLKATCCVEGKAALYAYARERNLPHRRCGKLIVAVNAAQAETLRSIQARAAANGVHDLQMLSADQVAAFEPALAAVAGLHSPSTGIIDVHELMLSYLGDAEGAGAMLALHSAIDDVARDSFGFVVRSGDTELRCDVFINAAGLIAQDVARRIEGLDAGTIPSLHLAKGNYFSLAAPPPFGMLVYPVPEPGGLGVHATINMGGQVTFGPDVEWVDAIDYTVDPARADRFYDAIRRYWPQLPDGALQPGYAGVRPKLNARGAPDGDFVVQGPHDHGVPGLVNFYGIESPGLTAGLALAGHALRKLAA